MLLWSGGLSALEMAMLIAAFPFTFIVLMLGISLFKALRSEYGIIKLEREQLLYESSYREETKRKLQEQRESFEETLPEEIAPHLADDGSGEDNK